MLQFFGRDSIFILPAEITDKKLAKALTNPEDWYNFPSPEQLKYKYIVKNKFKHFEKRFCPEYIKTLSKSKVQYLKP